MQFLIFIIGSVFGRQLIFHLLKNKLQPFPICFSELSSFSILPRDPLWLNFSRINIPLVGQPAFVALPRDISDIQNSLKCAQKHGLRVAVKGGGHSFPGYSSVQSPGFMINMNRLKKIEWLNNDTIIQVEAGTTWIDVYAAFKKRGGLYVITGGLCPSVGVVGFTLGGGVGPSVRQFGLASDNLVSVQMVTANGSAIVHSSSQINPDLFWALRGSGGSNFGVITKLQFKVFLGPEVYTFSRYCYDNNISNVRLLLKIISDHNSNLPWTVNIDITYSNDIFCLWVVFQGSESVLLKILNPLINQPSLPSVKEKLTKEFVCFHELIEFYAAEKGYSQYSSDPFTIQNCLIPSKSMHLLSKLVPLIEFPSNCGITLIHFGGVLTKRPVNSTSFPWRETEYMLDASCSWALGDSFMERKSREFLKHYFTRQVSALCKGAYVNFLSPDQENWLDLYYGSNLKRLQDVKRFWNPAGGPMRFPQEIH